MEKLRAFEVKCGRVCTSMNRRQDCDYMKEIYNKKLYNIHVYKNKFLHLDKKSYPKSQCNPFIITYISKY